MKLLFDQNLSFKLCQDVSDLFPGSCHVRDVGLTQVDDRTIWSFARANQLTIVSQDADFSDMAMLLGPPPKVIWVRSGNRPRVAIALLLRTYSGLIAEFEVNDAVCLEIY